MGNEAEEMKGEASICHHNFHSSVNVRERVPLIENAKLELKNLSHIYLGLSQQPVQCHHHFDFCGYFSTIDCNVASNGSNTVRWCSCFFCCCCYFCSTMIVGGGCSALLSLLLLAADAG